MTENQAIPDPDMSRDDDAQRAGDASDGENESASPDRPDGGMTQEAAPENERAGDDVVSQPDAESNPVAGVSPDGAQSQSVPVSEPDSVAEENVSAVMREALQRIRDKSRIAYTGTTHARSITKDEFIEILRDYIHAEMETLALNTVAYRNEVSRIAADNRRIIDGLEERIRALEANLEECRETGKQFVADREALRDEFNQYKAAMADAVAGGIDPDEHAAVTAERDRLRERVAELEKELDVMMDSIKNQIAQLGDSQTLRADISRLEAELAAARERIRELEKAVEEQKAAMEKQAARISELEAELKSLHDEYAAKLDALRQAGEEEKAQALAEQQTRFEEQLETTKMAHEAEKERLAHAHEEELKEWSDKLNGVYTDVRKKDQQIAMLTRAEDEKFAQLRKELDNMVFQLEQEKHAHEKSILEYKKRVGEIGVALDLFDIIDAEPDFDGTLKSLSDNAESNPLLPPIVTFLESDRDQYNAALEHMLQGKLDIAGWVQLKTALNGLNRAQALVASLS